MHNPTWGDPLGRNAWSDLNWPGQEAVKDSLVSLVALDAGRTPICVGTAFIVSARGRSAACLTAAHNLYAGISRIHYPGRHHPTTPPDFIPNYEDVDLDRLKFWAVYQKADHGEICAVTSVLWDKHADLALLTIEFQSPTDLDFVQGEWRLDDTVPIEGQIVGIVGWGGMAGTRLSEKAGQIERRLVLRVGRVLAVNDNGAMRYGPSIESTIPLLGGMSGGPAFMWREPGTPPAAFGFISSSPEPENSEVQVNFATPDRSTIGLLPIKSIHQQGDNRVVQLDLHRIERLIVGNKKMI